jgi:hypothetical protein
METASLTTTEFLEDFSQIMRSAATNLSLSEKVLLDSCKSLKAEESAVLESMRMIDESYALLRARNFVPLPDLPAL